MARISSLCVYCGSAGESAPLYRAMAETLGRILAAHKVRLVYGGGGIGLMGALARSARAHGGEVTGIIPGFLVVPEVGGTPGGDMIVVATMHERKQKMAELADAFAILPGSIGTLDEAIEIITWRQLGLHDKPILLVDQDGYWQPLLAQMRVFIEKGFAKPWLWELFHVVPGVEDVLPTLEALPPPVPGRRALDRG
ncbi:MAG: TIGR00730 family Rossman fold protein [Alphaproteobacteria bacterium]